MLRKHMTGRQMFTKDASEHLILIPTHDGYAHPIYNGYMQLLASYFNFHVFYFIFMYFIIFIIYFIIF